MSFFDRLSSTGLNLLSELSTIVAPLPTDGDEEDAMDSSDEAEKSVERNLPKHHTADSMTMAADDNSSRHNNTSSNDVSSDMSVDSKDDPYDVIDLNPTTNSIITSNNPIKNQQGDRDRDRDLEIQATLVASKEIEGLEAALISSKNKLTLMIEEKEMSSRYISQLEVDNRRLKQIENSNKAHIQDFTSQYEHTISMKDTELLALKNDLATATAAATAASTIDSSAMINAIEDKNSQIGRLEGALAEMEDLLKTAEETAWHARAEASELLFALEQEQHTVKATKQQLEQQRQLQEASNTVDSTTTVTVGISTDDSEILAEKNKFEDLYNKLLKSTSSLSSSSSSKYISIASSSEGKEIDDGKSTLIALEQQVSNMADKILQLQMSQEQMQSTLDEKEIELKGVTGNTDAALNQVAVLKQSLSKVETENRQLHQVIAQLRQVRRNNKEDADSVVSERDQLKDAVKTLTLKIADLEEKLRVQNDIESIEIELDRKGLLCDKLTYDIEALKDTLSVLQKSCYDKDNLIDTLNTDMIICKQGIDMKDVELSNIHDVLSQLQSQRDRTISKIHADNEAMLNDLVDRHAKEIVAVKSSYHSMIQEKEDAIAALVQQCEDEALQRRKIEYDCYNDKLKMQQQLEGALDQFRNSRVDGTVDREIVANLIVNYIQRNRPREVLDLIAKMLSFTDDQKAAVGLRVPSTNVIVTSIIRSIVGEPPIKVPDVVGNNLAELWINFLLLESEAVPPPAAATSAATGSSSAAKTSHAYVNQQSTASSPSSTTGASSVSSSPFLSTYNDSNSSGNSTDSSSGSSDRIRQNMIPAPLTLDIPNSRQQQQRSPSSFSMLPPSPSFTTIKSRPLPVIAAAATAAVVTANDSVASEDEYDDVNY